jgi:hypothetical protein
MGIGPGSAMLHSPLPPNPSPSTMEHGAHQVRVRQLGVPVVRPVAPIPGVQHQHCARVLHSRFRRKNMFVKISSWDKVMGIA